jgi:hypothetical protein
MLCLVVAPQRSEVADQVRARLEAAVDWTAAIQTALNHGLLPLFCARIRSDFSDCLPPEIRAAMDLFLEQHQGSVATLNQALVNIMELFDVAVIPAIPFKGPTLAQRAFGDVGLRLFSDLDILMPAARVDQAVQILLDNQYQHQAHLNPAQVRGVRHYGGQYFMFHPDTGVCVEPHWAFTPTTLAIDLDYDELFEAAVQDSFQGRMVLALAPEHETLMLCIHAGKEYWRSLKPVADLGGFLHRHPDLDWPQLLDLAQRRGCLRMVLVGLTLTHSLLDVEVPAACRESLAADPVAHELAGQLIISLARGQAPPLDPYHIDRYRLLLRERWSDRCRFLLRTICTPRSQHYGVINLPGLLRWCYVPLKLGWDYLVTPLWRLVK